jgi:hypothetical protein
MSYAHNCREAWVSGMTLQAADLARMQVAGEGQVLLTHPPTLSLIPDVPGKALACIHTSGCSRR